MALILNLDTATEKAGICLSRDGKTLALEENLDQKDHASWVHAAIGRLMKSTGCGMGSLQAVAVTAGPGSYTGLRVGMATAKGLCYALGVPLITENTLKVMAFAAAEQLPGTGLLCPMLDARRMEVFTAIYRADLSSLLSPTAVIVDENSFSDYLRQHRISFFGGGSYKCKPLIVAPNAAFIDLSYTVGHLGILSFYRYLQNGFTGLAYSEPTYTKEFHTHTKK